MLTWYKESIIIENPEDVFGVFGIFLSICAAIRKRICTFAAKTIWQTRLNGENRTPIEIVTMKKIAIRLIVILMILLSAGGCTGSKKSPVAAIISYNDAEGFTRADSIVGSAGDARADNPRVLAAIDSLEQQGELSQAKAIFYRTIIYNLMGQRNVSLRLYSQLAGINMDDLATQADFCAYLYSCINYVRMLCEMHRYDRALRAIQAADRKLKTIGYDTFTDHHDIAQITGECQYYLGQSDMAASSFQRSLQGVHTRLQQFHDPLDYRECQKTMNAIVRLYLQNGSCDEAQPWIAVQDSLYAAVKSHPQRDSVFLDEMRADICYSKALLAHGKGREAEAERAFNDYLATNTARQPASIINSCEYLMLTGRYAEASRNYEQLDHYLKENGYKADFENFGLFMIPKFRANLLAGRADSALRVAEVVAEYYDSALVRQRRLDSDLLTTFYDTAGKERMIAEQRAELSQQRLITVITILVIFAIFFVIYTMQRRKAYKKLDATNRQLMIANERAEESSRMKVDFIRQVSHEVRTPLNIISGFSQVLATPGMELDSAEMQDISRKMVENSDRITHLIDKMLDLSMMSSHAEIECEDNVRLSEVIAQAVMMSDIHKAAHLQFQVQQSPETEQLSIVTNKKAASNVLALLLGNAIKFTHPLAFKGQNTEGRLQHVTLSVSTDRQYVTLAVEDTGIGVPPEQAENIFKEFVQLDEYTDGTGIGLSIARSMARHMGGDVVLDTAYTAGARFVMSLPLKHSAGK